MASWLAAREVVSSWWVGGLIAGVVVVSITVACQDGTASRVKQRKASRIVVTAVIVDGGVGVCLRDTLFKGQILWSCPHPGPPRTSHPPSSNTVVVNPGWKGGGTLRGEGASTGRNGKTSLKITDTLAISTKEMQLLCPAKDYLSIYLWWHSWEGGGEWVAQEGSLSCIEPALWGLSLLKVKNP